MVHVFTEFEYETRQQCFSEREREVDEFVLGDGTKE